MRIVAAAEETVASALELELTHFLTFDRRQRVLAKAAGMKPVVLPA